MKDKNMVTTIFKVFENENINSAKYETLFPGGPTADEVCRTMADTISGFDGRKFTARCRAGLISELRGGIWCRAVFHRNVFAGTDAHMSRMEVAWNRIVSETLDVSNLMSPVLFGGTDNYVDTLSESGHQAQNRIFTAAKQLLAIDWCPAIVELTPILLMHMTESCAYYTIEELWGRRPLHFPVTRVEAKAWSLSFGSLLDVFYPRLYKILYECGALARRELECIFHHCFVSLLRFEHTVQIWDAWFKEGSKILFRYGLGLIYIFRKKIYALKLSNDQGSELWENIKTWAHEDDFNFDTLRKASFNIRTPFFRRPLTWDILEDCTKAMREHPLLLDISEHEFTKPVTITAAVAPSQTLRPSLADSNEVNEISFYWPPLKVSKDSNPVLLKEEELRATLVRWIPQVLRHKELKIVFSTERDGYSLMQLYRLCNKTAPSLLVIEIAETSELIGAYCTDPWHLSTTVYGSGQCFLFKLAPDSAVYKWKHGERRGSRGIGLDSSKHNFGTDAETEDPLVCRPPASDAHPFIHPLNHRSSHAGSNFDGSTRGIKFIGNISQNSMHRLQEMLPISTRHRMASQRAAALAANESSFMFATPYFMGLGASSTNVSCGLKLHEGLVRGSSSPSATFGNPCLVEAGLGGKAEFDISCVDVYGFS